jgi:hypothetical protein
MGALFLYLDRVTALSTGVVSSANRNSITRKQKKIWSSKFSPMASFVSSGLWTNMYIASYAANSLFERIQPWTYPA